MAHGRQRWPTFRVEREPGDFYDRAADAPTWRNRIVGSGEEAPDHLLAIALRVEPTSVSAA